MSPSSLPTKGNFLSRVEVEVADSGSYDGVSDFVGEPQSSLELRPTGLSKFRTGLAAAGLSPAGAPDLGPTEIDTSMTTGEVAFAILRRHFATMLAHEPGVRLGEDPEELHDMRVATRRLRAALKLYKKVYLGGPRTTRETSATSPMPLVKYATWTHLERFAGETLKEIVAALEQRRVEARRRMLEALDSNRYERFVSSFTGTLRRGRPHHRAHPGGGADLVLRRYKKVRKDVKALTEDSPPEDFHDLRKKGKRLRYALEPLRGIYGKPAERWSISQDVQDDLGDNQDLVVAAESMEELATAEAAAAGRILARREGRGLLPRRPELGRASSSPGRSGL